MGIRYVSKFNAPKVCMLIAVANALLNLSKCFHCWKNTCYMEQIFYLVFCSMKLMKGFDNDVINAKVGSDGIWTRYLKFWLSCVMASGNETEHVFQSL